MSFWSRVGGAFDRAAGITPNDNGPADINPGDPDGFQYVPAVNTTESRGLYVPLPSAWDGWPEEWSSPAWQASTGLKKLVDVAWACLDLNSGVLASMPVYKMRDGRIVRSETWMTNPDPSIYTSWQEFAKQLFWDYQMGEAFVLSYSSWSDGYPATFRVIPPFLVHVEMSTDGQQRRIYKLGGERGIDVTDRILHIRYAGTAFEPRGHSPLEAGMPRAVTIGLLQKYVDNIAETGGIPQYWIGVDKVLKSKQEAIDLLDGWIETRTRYAGQPAILGSGATLNQAQTMNARDMTLMELSQFNESRIAILCGVPPALVGLAGAAGSLTYSNISDLFDFHDRSSLRVKSHAVMGALSGWACPRGQTVELNRDDYTRLPLDQRMAAYKIAIEVGILTAEEVRVMERYTGQSASQALTGQEVTGTGSSIPSTARPAIGGRF